MKKTTLLSNIHSETQKLQRQNSNVLCSRSVRCLLSHVVVEFPNSRHMYALRTYFFKLLGQQRSKLVRLMNHGHAAAMATTNQPAIYLPYNIEW